MSEESKSFLPDQYTRRENGRYIGKNPVLVFFLWPYLNVVKIYVLKAYTASNSLNFNILLSISLVNMVRALDHMLIYILN